MPPENAPEVSSVPTAASDALEISGTSDTTDSTAGGSDGGDEAAGAGDMGDMGVPDVQSPDSGAAGGAGGEVRAQRKDPERAELVSPSHFGLSHSDILLIKARHAGWTKQIEAIRRHTGYLIDTVTAERWAREAVRAEKSA